MGVEGRIVKRRRGKSRLRGYEREGKIGARFRSNVMLPFCMHCEER